MGAACRVAAHLIGFHQGFISAGKFGDGLQGPRRVFKRLAHAL
jgi:hypothetical protein